MRIATIRKITFCIYHLQITSIQTIIFQKIQNKNQQKMFLGSDTTLLRK